MPAGSCWPEGELRINYTAYHHWSSLAGCFACPDHRKQYSWLLQHIQHKSSSKTLANSKYIIRHHTEKPMKKRLLAFWDYNWFLKQTGKKCIFKVCGFGMIIFESLKSVFCLFKCQENTNKIERSFQFTYPLGCSMKYDLLFVFQCLDPHVTCSIWFDTETRFWPKATQVITKEKSCNFLLAQIILTL